MDFILHIVADGLVIPIMLVAAFVILKLPSEHRWQAITRAIVMALTALLLAKIIAQFYHGARPFETLGVAPKVSFLQNPGFPSDHAVLVFTATIIVWAATRRKTISLVLLAMSIAVGLGRIFALVHTPLDIAGGAACALVAGLIWYGPQLRQNYYNIRLRQLAGRGANRSSLVKPKA